MLTAPLEEKPFLGPPSQKDGMCKKTLVDFVQRKGGQIKASDLCGLYQRFPWMPRAVGNLQAFCEKHRDLKYDPRDKDKPATVLYTPAALEDAVHVKESSRMTTRTVLGGVVDVFFGVIAKACGSVGVAKYTEEEQDVYKNVVDSFDETTFHPSPWQRKSWLAPKHPFRTSRRHGTSATKRIAKNDAYNTIVKDLQKCDVP